MEAKPAISSAETNQSRTGFFFALAAFTVWGLLPLFWKQTSHMDALEVTAHRAIWSLPVAGLILWLMGRTQDIIPTLKSTKRVGILFICSVLITFNWGIFIWAISVDRTIETALAYYINPLVSVAMGAIFLSERFNSLQLVAITIAFIAVLLLSVLGGTFPWISLSLAFTFALYGLLRKTVDVGPTQGFFVEILLLFPIALIYAIYIFVEDTSSFLLSTPIDNVILMLAGPATAIPLILFANGAKRLRLATIGMMQYLAPTLIFLTGLFIFKEEVSYWQWVAFIMIWVALAVYTWSLFIKEKS